MKILSDTELLTMCETRRVRPSEFAQRRLPFRLCQIPASVKEKDEMMYAFFSEQEEVGLDPWRYADGIDFHVAGETRGNFDVWLDPGGCVSNCHPHSIIFVHYTEARAVLCDQFLKPEGVPRAECEGHGIAVYPTTQILTGESTPELWVESLAAELWERYVVACRLKPEDLHKLVDLAIEHGRQ